MLKTVIRLYVTGCLVKRVYSVEITERIAPTAIKQIEVTKAVPRRSILLCNILSE
jgi:hypothetical protein